MKFAVSYKALADAITSVGKAVATKGVEVTLSNFHITVENDKMRVVGTDNEVMMISYINAEIETEGVFAISAKLLQDFITSLPSDNNSMVVFELENIEFGLMTIKCGATNFKVQIQGVEDYPPLPVIDTNTGFVVDKEILLRGLKETSIGVSSDEGNPILKSMCFDFENEECPTLAATDSKRLAVSRLRGFEVPEELRKVFIVPHRAISEIQRVLEGKDEVRLAMHGNQLLFSSEKIQFITRLIDGRFPSYEKIIPKDSSRVAKFRRDDLVPALKIVGQVARNIMGFIALEVKDGETRFWSDAREFGMCEHRVPCELTGEPISMGFNVKFMQDFVNVIHDEEVYLEMTTPHYPGVLRPVNPESEFKYVIMPMPTLG
jgi:DNA polymerase-3 subunit beta